MFTDDEIVAVSALEHYSYCPRQCALIHVERVFDENVFTLKGRLSHERADEPTSRTENGVRIERGLSIWSDRLGIVGKADVVEFYPGGAVRPVEYKSGPRRQRIHDDIQLCAQALCLEDMLGVTVADGAIFSLVTKRRRVVDFDRSIRELTELTIERVRALVASSGPLPPAVADKRCAHCSLADACVPATVVSARASRLYDKLYEPFEVLEVVP